MHLTRLGDLDLMPGNLPAAVALVALLLHLLHHRPHTDCPNPRAAPAARRARLDAALLRPIMIHDTLCPRFTRVPRTAKFGEVRLLVLVDVDLQYVPTDEVLRRPGRGVRGQNSAYVPWRQRGSFCYHTTTTGTTVLLHR